VTQALGWDRSDCGLEYASAGEKISPSNPRFSLEEKMDSPDFISESGGAIANCC
jgi:hypothetical protein